jgi:hypothetical protein
VLARYARSVEWFLDDNGKLVAVDQAEELRRMVRSAQELSAHNRARIAESRALALRVRTLVNARKLWCQGFLRDTVH